MTLAKRDPIQELLTAAQGSCHLWMSTEDVAYATFIEDQIKQSWPIDSIEFKSWLTMLSFNNGLGLASTETLSRLLNYLNAAARKGRRMRTASRVHQENDTLFLASGDRNWSVIEVNKTGYLTHPIMPTGMPFTRSSVLAPYTHPAVGGTINLLRSYINVRSDDDFMLIVGFILASLRDSREYPVLVINGAQGSAKTTTTNFISSLVDPSFDSASKLPDSVRDLGVMARNRHLLSFDNLSFLHPKMSDAICQIATGLTINERRYYTNADTFSYQVFRPIILNGIPQMVDRDDLGRRMFNISLDAVPPGRKIPIDILQQQFDLDKPLIWGAILNALSCALANYATTPRPAVDGLVSVAQWVEAAAPALGWAPGAFTSIYNANRRTAIDSILDGDEFARLITDMLLTEGGRFEGDFEGFIAKSAMHRRGDKKNEYFPQDAKRWIEKLKRIAPALETQGIHMKGLEPIKGKEWRDPKTRRRLVEITQRKQP